MTYCDLCDLELEWCEHGLQARRELSSQSGVLLISPSNQAHFPGCPHKGGDEDYSQWAELDVPNAWDRLRNGEQLSATGGSRIDRVATSRCLDCVDHGPWA
jgi:hypothetical protein